MRQTTADKINKQVQFELKRDSYPEGFPPLPEIPGGRYISDEFYDLEMEHYWKKSWLCAIRADEIPDPGCYKLFKRLHIPVVITRGKDQQIRAFYNTCRHRGAPLVEEDGKRQLLTCRYHHGDAVLWQPSDGKAPA